MTDVTAIIPTTGRVNLRRAVLSVSNQTVPVDLLVVLDRPENESNVRALLNGLNYHLLLTTGNVGGAEARNIGVRNSETNIVAFLDDDDEWLPHKIEIQRESFVSSENSIITCNAFLIGKKKLEVPEEPFMQGTDLASYLLKRSTLKLRKNFMQSSTLLMRKEDALEVPWQTGSARHQDWTLLIENNRVGRKIVTVTEPLVNVYQGSQGSISKSGDWKFSQQWLDSIAQPTTQRSRADFVCSVVARSAFRSGDNRQGFSFILNSLKDRPHLAAIIVGVSGILSK